MSSGYGESGGPEAERPAKGDPPSVSTGTIRALAGLLLAVAVAAGVIWLNDSPLLPATHADGVKYLSAAASLVAGGELADPVVPWSSTRDERFLAHFPPGYPLTLAALVRSGLRPDVAALCLTAAAAGLTALLLFVVASLLAGWWAGFLAVAFFFAAPPVVLLHSTVWSEPLYLPLVVALVGTMALWPRRSEIHGALAALGVLVRYAGVAGVAAAGIWAWYRWDGRRGSGGRRRAVATAVVPGVVALAVWGVVASARRESVRSFGFYGAGLWEDLTTLAGSLVGWLAPIAAGPAAFRWVAASAVGTVAVALWVRALQEPAPPGRRRVAAASALFAACYVATVVLARLLADREIPLDARIFMPVFLVATLWTVVAWATVLGGARAAPGPGTSDPGTAGEGSAPPSGAPGWRRLPGTALAGTLVAALWLGGSAWTNAVGIPVVKDQGRFYTAWVWFTSDVVEWVEGPSREWSHVYSNEPWLLLFQTGRTPRLLPTENDVGDWSAFVAVYRERPGPIVVLYPLRPDDLTPDELQARLGLRTELVRNEGVVLVPAADESPTPASTIRGALAPDPEGSAPRAPDPGQK